MTKPQQSESADKVRLDKWLWAARFFKTRAVAKHAIEGGKVHYNGGRSKCSRMVEVGAELTIRQGVDEKTVEVVAISDQRRGAPEAAKLYVETETSVEKRRQDAEQRKALKGAAGLVEGRPSKKDRRKIHEFKQRNRETD
jgi:ribosome-associated heat shock protein Hsp15